MTIHAIWPHECQLFYWSLPSGLRSLPSLLLFISLLFHLRCGRCASLEQVDHNRLTLRND